MEHTTARVMHLNSLRAFDSIKEKLNAKQSEVLDVYRDGNYYTDQEVADKLGWPINRVSGRVGELIRKDRIYHVDNIFKDGSKRRRCQIITNKPLKLF